MINRELPWTTGMREVTVADVNLPTDQSIGIAGLSGSYLKRSYGITALPTDLIDDCIHDDFAYTALGLGNIHDHGITAAKSTLARSTYSCHRVNDNIDGLHGLSELRGLGCFDGIEKDPGDEFEGGWLTYAVPGLAVATMLFLLVDHVINSDK